MNVKRSFLFFVGLALLNKVDQLADEETTTDNQQESLFHRGEIKHDTVSRDANDVRLEESMLDTQLLDKWAMVVIN